MMDVNESELVLRLVSNRVTTHGAIRIKISERATLRQQSTRNLVGDYIT